MIDFKKLQLQIYETLIKSTVGKVLVVRTETNEQGTTYSHKHWINPEEINSKTDKVIGGFHNLPNDHPQQLHSDIKSAQFSANGEFNKELTDKLNMGNVIGKTNDKGQRYFEIEDNTYSLREISDKLKDILNQSQADKSKSIRGVKTSNLDTSINPKELELEYEPWINSLSEDELTALKKYTASGYSTINKTLRKISSQGIPVVTKNIDETIDLITSALNKAEVKHPLTVYRKVRGLDLLDKLEKCWEFGGIWEDPAFMSTTVTKGAFNPVSPNGPIHLVIDIPTGHGIGGFVRAISKYPKENEFLLNKGSKFKVNKIENGDKPKEYVVHLSLFGKSSDNYTPPTK